MVMQGISLDLDQWPDGLNDARARIRRAKEHADALQTDSDAYVATQPFELVATFEPDARCHVVRLHVKEEPPLRLSTIIGDVGHNLRAALDSISWRLSVAHIGVENAMAKRQAIDFPITDTPEKFAKDAAMKFVSDDAREVFERVQPYNRRFMNMPDAPLWADPLIRLQELSNIDKHCTLHQAFVNISDAVTFPGVRNPTDLPRVRVESNLEAGGSVEDGSEMSRVTFPADIPPEDTDIQLGQPTLNVTFGNGITPEALEHTVYMIAAVVQDFSEIIEKSPIGSASAE